MAIDADINAGSAYSGRSIKKREELSKETDFYSAMDGATKFVKGDAIAAVLILAINIIGGLAIGIGQHGLPLSIAAETYIFALGWRWFSSSDSISPIIHRNSNHRDAGFCRA